MSDHLIELADGWSLWTWFRVRGAGFRCDRVLELAAPAAARAADAVEQALDRWLEVRAAELERLHADLSQATESERKPLLRELRKLRRRSPPTAGDTVVDTHGKNMQVASADVLRARAEFERAFAEDSRAVSAAVRAIASEPRSAPVSVAPSASHCEAMAICVSPCVLMVPAPRNSSLRCSPSA